MSVCGSSPPWVSKLNSDMDALDELLADFDVEPPMDPTERLAWIDERSAKLGALMAEAAGIITRNGVEAYAASLVAAGDVSALDAMSTIWRSFVTEVVGEYTAGMYLGGNLSTFIAGPGASIGSDDAAGWAAVVNENAAAYQATATNRIVGASNDLWGDVRAKTVESINSGMSGEKLKSQIEDITGYSEFRADTIGRTEAQSAFNGGQLDGARALGEFGPQYKRWMAVGDSRTRKTHERADGQVVAMDDKFEIGTSRMDRPLDRSAPPEESINCRCLMELLWVEDLSDEERDRLGLEAETVEPVVDQFEFEPKIIDASLDSTLMGDDWRRSSDLQVRGTAVWQHEYESMRAVRQAEVNLRAGRAALDDVEVPNLKKLRYAKDEDYEAVEVLSVDDMRNEIESSARVLRQALDEADASSPAMYRGMTVGDDFTLSKGQAIDLDVTSFTDDVREAVLYTENDYYGNRAGSRAVVIEVLPGARAVSLKGLATGRMARSSERVYQGRLVIESVEQRGDILYAIAAAV